MGLAGLSVLDWPLFAHLVSVPESLLDQLASMGLSSLLWPFGLNGPILTPLWVGRPLWSQLVFLGLTSLSFSRLIFVAPVWESRNIFSLLVLSNIWISIFGVVFCFSRTAFFSEQNLFS